MSVSRALPFSEAIAGSGKLRLSLWLLVASWTALIAGLAGWSAYKAYQAEVRSAATAALDNFNKDLIYRRWAAKQGGVYVPISAETPPNPYLTGIPEREVTTPSGRQLTLVNPAYMTRQVHELGKTQYGVRAHITSLKPIRPENAADAWETRALEQFDKGGKEVVSLEMLDGAPFLRFMRPLPTAEACLTCHAIQGYKLGDVRGGISVSLPWAPYREHWFSHLLLDVSIFAGIWLLGLVGIGAWHRRLRRYLRESGRADEQVRAERDRAQQSEELLRESQLIAGQGSYVLDISAGSWKSSEVLDRIFGLDEGYERTVAGWAELIDPDDRTLMLDYLRDEVVGRGQPFDREYRIIRRNDQARRWVYGLGRLECDAQGRPQTMRGTIQDITERKMAEAKLISITQAVESASDAIGISDARGHHFYQNRALSNLFEYATAEELEAAGGGPVVVKDPQVAREMFEHIMSGESWAGELEMVTKSGRVFPAYERADAVKDRDGKIVGLVGVITDITEHKLAQAALQESEARYRRITEGLTDYQYTVRVENGHAVATTQSPACALVTGYTAEEFAAEPYLWIRMVAPEDRDQVTRRVERILAGEDIPPIEHRIQRKDGATRWVRDTTILLRDAGGRLLSYDGVIKDITESVIADAAVAASEAKYRTLFEESRDVIYISTPSGSFVDINRAGVALLGYPSQEALMAVAFRDLFLRPEDRSRLLDLLDKSDFVEDFKTAFVRLDRQQVQVSITATAVREASGKMTAIRGIIRDITENQKLEAQFRQSQKMESIGTLAGGVAHDFNNILATISGYGQLILIKMAPDDPHRLSIQHILEASERAAHLTGDLLLFSRKQPINRKPVDLNEGIRKLSKFLMRVIGEDIAFKAELAAGEIPVLADEHQISQVLMNLAANARDAMQRGGVFTITTETVLLDEQFVATHNFGKPGRYALITAADTGTGMDEQALQRIFEPFFTTKDPGKGTGLGLAVVYGIVKQHDGLVTVYSEPGRGSTFRVYLPVTTMEAAEEQAPAAERPVGGTETILLAEDDRAVREMTLLLLRDYGYTVISAVDGEDALRKFRENQGRIQLLLFDLVMPKRTGKDAFDEIRRLQPDVKVVFSSGYDPDMVRQQSLMEMNLPLIRKPVEISALLKLIRSVLDS